MDGYRFKSSLRRFIFLYLLVVFSLHQLSVCRARQVDSAAPPVAQSGQMDLSHWPLKEMGAVPLAGEWEFFWERQLEPDAFKGNASLEPEWITLPRLWNGYSSKGTELGGDGFATFRLTVRLSKADQVLGLKIMDVNTAGRVYVNGKLLTSSGTPGTRAETTTPFLKPQISEFKIDEPTLEIVLHISNFHDRIGGIRQAIMLGTADQVVDMRSRSLAFEFLLFGSILIMALYHLGLFILRRKGTSALYFSLFCFLIALRTVLTGERYLMVLAPWIPWSMAVKLEILSFYLAVPAFCMFVRTLFSWKFSEKILRIIQVFSVVFSAIVVISPIKYGTWTLPFFQSLTLLVILYVIYVNILSIRKKQEGALIFALGFLVLFLTTLNDILYDNKILDTGFWVPFGVFVFIFSQAFLLSVRFSKAFQRVEILSEELGEKSEELSRKNIELQQHRDTLEQKVIERTESIKVLLDNTGQGFLTFRNNYSIDPLYSKACQIFFSDPIEQKNALQLLTSGNQQHDEKAIKEMLDLVFDGVSSIELFSDILPGELVIDDRILKTEYRMIPPAGTETQYRVMVILTDITRERELAEQLKQDEERKEVIVKIAIDKAGFIEFINEMNLQFQTLKQHIDLPEDEIDPNALFRSIHTIKGGSGSYALKPVSELAHQIESQLDVFRSNQKALDALAKASLAETILSLEKRFHETIDSFSDVISTEELKPKERVYQVPQSKLEKLKQHLQAFVPGDDQNPVFRHLDTLYQQSLAPVLRRYKQTAEELAVQLSKSVEVRLSGMDTEVSMPRFDQLLSMLVHLVRNSVDHGLEDPDLRSMAGKSPSGILDISVHQEKEQLVIRVADDGGGIDPERIKTLAISKGITTEREAEALSDRQSIALIFHPGFSTAEAVSDISGRGVGMDAVQTAVRGLGGKIDIQSEIGKGTSFTITVPI